MAYRKEMKKINLGLSQDDYDRLQGIQSFMDIGTDSEAIRFCIRNTYLSLCQDKCFLEQSHKIVEEIESLKCHLLALIRSE